MEDNKKDYQFIGLSTVSIIYAVSAIAFLFLNHNYGTKLKLNEIGDYLAGVFSPLAFFWLIYGYWMQNSELKLNRLSIERQANELKEATRIQHKREFNFFKSSQPIIDIKKIFFLNNNTLCIEFKNNGSIASNAFFSTKLTNNYLLEDIDIKKGQNYVELIYPDIKGRIKSLNLEEKVTQTFDTVLINYVDSRNLEQQSIIKIEVTKYSTDEITFSIGLQQYFDGELLD